ncbi:MAG: sulfite exporter TauE/SafE family protein [Alphaproteobacteria bacterium]|nr:sulfite exporter TauE/SafE family protein [Alphaproteobacteria bacterium]
METLLAHCVNAFAEHGALLPAFFLAGLTGGFTHCLAMCGPFVACERMCGSRACAGSGEKLRGAVAIPYHAGRMTTYGALGFGAALLSKQVAAYSWWPWLAAAMLAGAGILFLISCANACRHEAGHSPLFRLTYARGVLLGFMPCGLLYAALMVAATLVNPWSGMLAMWLFTLGTMPALLIVSGGAELFTRRWRQAMQTLGRAMMAFNGLSLLVMAARTVR